MVAAIRLHVPGAESPPAAATLTLRAVFESFLLPDLIEQGRSPATIAEYSNSLRLWELLTTDPSLAELERDHKETLKAFIRDLKASRQPQYRPATICKIWRHLRPVIRRAGPLGDHNPDGEGIIGFVRPPRLPAVPRRINRVANLDELQALSEGCRVATWPKRGNIAPEVMWRAAIVSFYNLGPRCWDLWCADPATPHSSGWRWPQINLRAGSLRYLPDKTEEAGEIEIPLNRVCVTHLAGIKREWSAVFPASKSRGALYGQWAQIKAAAAATCPSVLDLEIQNLRGTCQTEFDSIHVGLGDFMVGHAPDGVGPSFYRNFFRKAKEAAEQLPQPAGFLDILR